MIALCLGGIAAAQTGGGVIGVVKDESGGAVPGAAIKVVNEGTGEAVDAFTNEQGSYDVAGLARGPYRVEVMLDGFESIMRRVVLEAGQTETIDNHSGPSAIYGRCSGDRPARRGSCPGGSDTGIGPDTVSWSPMQALST